MKIIVDTSVVIAVLLNEHHKTELVEMTKGAELFAPGSLYYEIGNAFSAMIKQKRIPVETLLQAIEYFFEIPITLFDVDLKNSLKISEKHTLYAYDAFFIDCAQRNKMPLLTLDKKLAQAAKEERIEIMEVKK
ncbi:MAG: type II toxin-antitoxin system VapC family toxin [Ignavibacteriaceae bacterium]|jgi:predicted nucleic acid-binding protein|nr:type II toxin-antitoxin system VapC family toxin [Ignavibacteriaceae bacterium]